MANDILVPNLGESIIEATVSRWLKKPGDPVQPGDVLVEIETDKVNLEVGADRAGVLASISVQEGQDVKVGEILGKIEDSTTPAFSSKTEATEEEKQQTDESKKNAEEKISKQVPSPQAQPESQTTEATPLAKRIAKDRGVDLSQIRGSGPGGRIHKEDVEHVASGDGKDLPSIENQPAQTSLTANDMDRFQGERVRLSRRRRTIAQRLVESQQSTAMLTTFNDVDMTNIMEIRQRQKDAFQERYGISLGIVSFFVKASIYALKKIPQVNSEIQGDDLLIKKYYDIGIAVAADEGLVVPVLRNADQTNFDEIEKNIAGFIQKAKDNTFSLDELQGGTFTITNGGVFGSLLSTPILNYPQAAILGLHRIEKRPVAFNDEIALRSMMYLALSYDHRIIDGREAVQFLAHVKAAIENPELLFLFR